MRVELVISTVVPEAVREPLSCPALQDEFVKRETILPELTPVILKVGVAMIPGVEAGDKREIPEGAEGGEEALPPRGL